MSSQPMLADEIWTHCPVSVTDVCPHSVFGLSSHACQLFESHKSLEAHDQFTGGFVRNLTI